MLDKLILKYSIEFDGSLAELKEWIHLKKDREFRLEWTDDSSFKFVSNSSAGTLIVNYLSVEGIRGFAKLTEDKSGRAYLELKTKIRIELYLFFVIAIIIIVVGFISEDQLPLWILGLFPFIIIWFWWIYRIQENRLFKKLKKYIIADIKTV